MRRQDIQLLALARQGDAAARREVGRRYLLGSDGFPHHVASGLDYLARDDDPAAARIVAEALPLAELLALDQLPALERAAQAGSAAAQRKLAAWRVLRDGGDIAALPRDDADLQLPAVARVAAQQALAGAPLPQLSRCLRHALALADRGSGDGATADLAALVVDAVQRAETEQTPLQGLSADALATILDQRAMQGDRIAAYALGRALCGITNPAFAPELFAEHQNMRRGAAFLLRAADAGQDDAWLHLYRLHADHRLSVANPQMARFFLEKAATRGLAEAQRKLGALLLREATALAESEQAIHWLHQAAGQGDAPARELLDSLVLPVADDDDDDAQQAIEELRRSDPWLAIRLQLARVFGLTKLEALSVDPAEGLRPWGLVVGRNPFVSQSRLAAPRAIPALSAAAMEAARQAASFFGQARGDARSAEGDLRRRSARQRRAFERLGLDDSMFFAEATAMTLEALRLGPKWAFRARQPLRSALAA
ncbi:hypothetical protein [Aquabacterium humicola]|uniref:hypothetical protein n=1 Tax=Aquabacterium humicola TaxID=3237377 RepID=UPI0025432DBB|nr:hypothetical protein [Rubrivivax pictus]